MYSPLLTAAQKEKVYEVCWRCCWVLGVRNPQSIACEVWSLHFQDKLYNSDSLLVVLILFFMICYWLFTYNVTICMKFDHDIHIVMHSVLSLKSGVIRRTATTHSAQHMQFSLEDPARTSLGPGSGNWRCRTNASFSSCCSSNGKSGQQIASSEGVDKQIPSGNCAEQDPRPYHTLPPIAPTRSQFGHWSHSK